jgi:hypothetical protein
VKKTNEYKQEQNRAPRKKGKGMQNKKKKRLNGRREEKQSALVILYVRKTKTHREVRES